MSFNCGGDNLERRLTPLSALCRKIARFSRHLLEFLNWIVCRGLMDCFARPGGLRRRESTVRHSSTVTAFGPNGRRSVPFRGYLSDVQVRDLTGFNALPELTIP